MTMPNDKFMVGDYAKIKPGAFNSNELVRIASGAKHPSVFGLEDSEGWIYDVWIPGFPKTQRYYERELSRVHIVVCE